MSGQDSPGRDSSGSSDQVRSGQVRSAGFSRVQNFSTDRIVTVTYLSMNRGKQKSEQQ